MTDAKTLDPSARATPDDQSDHVPAALERNATDEFEQLKALFENWSWWSYSRGYFGPPASRANTLGSLSSKSRAFRRSGGPDAACSAQLHAINLAIQAQPVHALDTQVFMAYYRDRVGNVKAAAGKLGIGRQHFYTLLRSFCRRVHAGAQRIEAANLAERARLEHASQILEMQD